MANQNETTTRITKSIRWTARIWGTVVFLIALFIFAGYAYNWATTGTADPHTAPGYPPIENLPPILIFVSALGLAIAWRWEGLGGAIAVLGQLVNLPVLLIHWPLSERFPAYLLAPYGVSAAVAVPGILFLVCWWTARRSRPSRTSA